MLLIVTEISDELAISVLKVVEKEGINYSWTAVKTEAARLRKFGNRLPTRNAS
jgi:hypothetical protein